MQSSTSQLLQQQQQQPQPVKPPTLFAGLVNSVKNSTSPYHQPGTTDVVCSTPLLLPARQLMVSIAVHLQKSMVDAKKLSGVDPWCCSYITQKVGFNINYRKIVCCQRIQKKTK